MPSAAANRLHIVVLSQDELPEQLELGRETISLAVDRGADSPGQGRIAVIVTDNDHGEAVVSHLGLVRSGSARTNLDGVWVLSAIRSIGTPIELSELGPALGRAYHIVQKRLSLRRGGALPPSASSALRSAIEARIGKDEWPSVDSVPRWMMLRVDGHLRQDHANAVGTALLFSGMDPGALQSAPLLGESPLASLRLAPSEASLIENDLRSFPHMSAETVREDICRFTDGKHTLDVMNVNATRIEAATGVDLVYCSHDYGCFVLVQYKRMEREDGSRIARVDQRLPDQLRRMRAVDGLGQTSTSATGHRGYRLGHGSTFVKFAYPVETPYKAKELTRGLYVPSELLLQLYDGGQLKGPRRGDVVTHDSLGRWFSNDQFTELVKNGWVGSSGISVQDVREFVAASLEDGRIAVVAAHNSS